MKPYLAKYEEEPKNKKFDAIGTGETKTMEDSDPDEFMPSTTITETMEDSDPDEFFK